MLVARILGVVVALVICGWFVLGVRQAHDIGVATAIVTSHPTQSAHARKLLRSAKTLNPDLEVDVLLARAMLLEHHPRRALRVLGGVVDREPMNLEAWLYFAEAAFTVNRPALIHAAQEIKLLDPKR